MEHWLSERDEYYSKKARHSRRCAALSSLSTEPTGTINSDTSLTNITPPLGDPVTISYATASLPLFLMHSNNNNVTREAENMDDSTKKDSLKRKRKKCKQEASASTQVQETKKAKMVPIHFDLPRTPSGPLSIDVFLKYPELFEDCFNRADASSLVHIFNDKCVDGFVVSSCYADAQGQIIHHPAVLCTQGWTEYKKHLEKMFRCVPDFVMLTDEQHVERPRADALVVSSAFVARGNYLSMEALAPANEISPDDNLPPRSPADAETASPPTLSHSPTQSYSHSHVPTHSHSHSHSSRSNDCCLFREMLQRQQSKNFENSLSKSSYILGQFLPLRSNQYLVPGRDSVYIARSAEISVKGRIKFHINCRSQLIRRIEFRYEQDCDLCSAPHAWVLA